MDQFSRHLSAAASEAARTSADPLSMINEVSDDHFKIEPVVDPHVVNGPSGYSTATVAAIDMANRLDDEAAGDEPPPYKKREQAEARSAMLGRLIEAIDQNIVQLTWVIREMDDADRDLYSGRFYELHYSAGDLIKHINRLYGREVAPPILQRNGRLCGLASAFTANNH